MWITLFYEDAAMISLEELKECQDKIEGFSHRFIEQSGDQFLSASDTANFKQNVLETIDLLTDAFGENNNYIQEINRTIEKRSIPYDGSPTFECVKQVAAIIGAAHTQFKRKSSNKAINQTATKHIDFVDVSRLDELKSIGKEKYDLSRLVRLCEELNMAHHSDSHLSMAMLMRAIIDHVPPIFDVTKFSEVANSYKGSKSFKDSMAHLESSLRKIADSHLHVQIRKREVLPTYSQVNYSADLDVLLSEIVRILK